MIEEDKKYFTFFAIVITIKVHKQIDTERSNKNGKGYIRLESTF